MKTQKERREQIVGAVFFFLFLIFIALGIIEKRVYGHPDWMVFFHLPAAVFLVIAGRNLSGQVRKRYREELARLQRDQPTNF
jgi:hypothetical protein